MVVLSGEVISEEYSLEYGTDIMEMHVGAVQAGERALVVDDLIATGGTLAAAIRLLGILSFSLELLFIFICTSEYSFLQDFALKCYLISIWLQLQYFPLPACISNSFRV